MPPSQDPGVSSRVLAPERAACRAAATPPLPPPQTRTAAGWMVETTIGKALRTNTLAAPERPYHPLPGVQGRRQLRLSRIG
jgi:hypothetical protein